MRASHTDQTRERAASIPSTRRQRCAATAARWALLGLLALGCDDPLTTPNDAGCAPPECHADDDLTFCVPPVRDCPASCAEALARDPQLGSGLQCICPTGPLAPVGVQCDMREGGWTLAITGHEPGYAAVLPVTPRAEGLPRTLTGAVTGRLTDDEIAALLAASPAGTNNVRVEVGGDALGPAWTVSLQTGASDRAIYRVETDANGDCSASDPGPDPAATTPGGWGFVNGSGGADVGFVDGAVRAHDYAGFLVSVEAGADACDGAARGAPSEVATRGRVWIR